MIKSHAEFFASRSVRRRAFSLGLLWVFAATLPVLAQDKAAQLMAGESLGGIKIGMAEKKLKDLIGQPKKKGPVKLTEATGEYDQTWLYPDKGLEITLSAQSKTGAKTVTSFTASTGCGLTTTKGIRIGSAEADVRKAYGSFEDKENGSMGQKNSLVAGSIYGGIIFTFKDKKVTRIFFGAAAE
jgi:hypothetical protein